MCGIAGSIDLQGRDRVDPALTRAMTARIAHRGPDGEGFFDAPGVSLGMRRLSIIDVAGGDQPIFNEEGTLALVFNGEIYNYIELRQALSALGHRFATQTDTETIVHLYEQYGLSLFDHLRGMYAFALWDASRARLVLAVDHIGMKPLYLTQCNGRLLFASEIKALLVDPEVQATPDPAVLDTALTFGYMLGEQTLFIGIRRLMPGHYLVVDTRTGSVEQGRFWSWADADRDPLAAGPAPVTPDEAVEQTRLLLQDSVRLHLRSDVPLGLFLSGGIDSATMLALMSTCEPDSVVTFTVGYDIPTGDNELEQARRVARHFHARHRELVISAEDWWQHFEAFVYHVDEPIDNPSAVSLQALARLAAQEVKVVLNGTGGDELFCGYQSHAAWPPLLRLSARLDRLLAPEWRAKLVGRPLGLLEPWYATLKRYPVLGALPYYLPRWQMPLLPVEEALRRGISYEGYTLWEGLRRRLYSPDLNALRRQVGHKEAAFADLLAEAHRRNDNPVDIVQALVALTWLPADALLVADKVTMAHSLELRVPFFDRPLLDFAIRLPPYLKARGNKWLLREAMRPYLPPWALERPKQWFGSPVQTWLDRPLRDRAQAILLDRRTLERGYFRQQAVVDLVERHFSGRENHIQLVLRLLTLELWQRAFVDGEQRS